jgi:hypothetical protein
MLRDSGCLVECRDFGALDDRPRSIGDQAADAAPAGLGQRHRTNAQEDNTNRKNIPCRLDHCISAVHEYAPVFMQRSNFVAMQISSRTFRLIAENGKMPLLKRINSAWMRHRPSREKQGLFRGRLT